MSDIIVNLDINNTGFNIKIRNAERLLNQFGRTLRDTESTTRRSSKGFESISAAMRDLTVASHGVAQALSMTKTMLFDWQHSIIKASAEIEKLTILLTGLSDAQTQFSKNYDAHKNLKDMIALAKEAPFAMNEMMKSFVKFQSVKLDDPKRMVQGLADAIAAFGGGNDEFHRASVAITQMAGKGVISMEELRQQLGEAVPSAISVMAKKLGMSYAQLVEVVSSGSLSARKGLNALLEGFEEDFGGMAKRMMETWSGMVSQLQTNWLMFRDEIGRGGLFDAGKGFLSDINKALTDPEVLKWANHFGERLGIMVSRLNEMFNWIVANREQVEKFIDVSTTLFAVWAGGKIFGGLISGGAALFGPYLEGIGRINAAITATASTLTNILFAPAIAGFALMQQQVRNAFMAMLGYATTAALGMTSAFLSATASVSGAFAALLSPIRKVFLALGVSIVASVAGLGKLGSMAMGLIKVFGMFFPPLRLMAGALAVGASAWVYLTESVNEAGKKIGIFDRLTRDVNNLLETDALLQWRVLWDRAGDAVGKFWDGLYDKTINYFPFLDTLEGKLSKFFTETLPDFFENLPAKIEEFFTGDALTVVRYEVEADYKSAQDDAQKVNDAINSALELREKLVKRIEETGSNLTAKDQEDQRQYIAWLEILEKRYEELNASLADAEQRRLDIVQSATNDQVRAYEQRKVEILSAVEDIKNQIDATNKEIGANPNSDSTQENIEKIKNLQQQLKDLQDEYHSLGQSQQGLLTEEQQIRFEALGRTTDLLRKEVENAGKALDDFNDKSKNSVEIAKILTPEMRAAKNAYMGFADAANKVINDGIPGKKELTQIQNITEEYKRFLEGIPTLLGDTSLGFTEENIRSMADLYQRVIDTLTVKRLEALRELTATFDSVLAKTNEFKIALTKLSTEAKQFDQVYEIKINDEQFQSQLREQAKQIYQYSEYTGELTESSRKAAEASLKQVEAQIKEAEAAGKSTEEINRLRIAKEVLNTVIDGSIRFQYNEQEAIEAQIKTRNLQIELFEALGMSYKAVQARREQSLVGLSEEQQSLQKTIYFVEDLKSALGSAWDALSEFDEGVSATIMDIGSAIWDAAVYVWDAAGELDKSLSAYIKSYKDLSTKILSASGERRKAILKNREEELNQYSVIDPRYWKTKSLHKAEDETASRAMSVALLEMQGEAYDALQAKRNAEIKNLSEEQITIYRSINLAEDMVKSRNLVIENMETQGQHYAALQVKRTIELQGLSDENRSLVKQKHNLDDLNKARELQIQLLEAQGKTGLADNLRRSNEQIDRQNMPEWMQDSYTRIDGERNLSKVKSALKSMYEAAGQGQEAYAIELDVRRKAVAGTNLSGILEQQIKNEEQQRLNEILSQQEVAFGRTWRSVEMYRQKLLDAAKTAQEFAGLLELFKLEDEADLRDRNIELLEAQGRSYEALQAKREKELLGLKGEALGLQRLIYLAEDEQRIRSAQINLLKAHGYSYAALQRERSQELKAASPELALLLQQTYAAEDYNSAVDRQVKILSMLGDKHAEVARQRMLELRSVSKAESGLLRLQHVLEDIAKIQEDALAEQDFGTELVSFYSNLDKETKDLLGGERFVDVYNPTDILSTTRTLQDSALDALRGVNNLGDEVSGNINNSFDTLEQRLNALVGQFKRAIDEISTQSSEFGGGGAKTYPYVDVTTKGSARGTASSVISGPVGDLLDHIGNAEAPAGYSAIFGGYENVLRKQDASFDLTQKTIAEVLEIQRQSIANQRRNGAEKPSGAIGRYQFTQGTLTGLVKEMGLSLDTKFNAETQDSLAIRLLEQIGLRELENGDLSPNVFANKASNIWAALKNSSGRGAYDGDAAGNMGYVSYQETLQKVQAIGGSAQGSDDFNEMLERTTDEAGRATQALAVQEQQVNSLGNTAKESGTKIEHGLTGANLWGRESQEVEEWRLAQVNAIKYREELIKRLKDEEGLTEEQIHRDQRVVDAQNAVTAANKTYNTNLEKRHKSQTEAIQSGELLTYAYQLEDARIKQLGDSYGTAQSVQRQYNLNIANAIQLLNAGEMSLYEYNKAVKEQGWALMEAQGPFEAWIVSLEKSIPTLEEFTVDVMDKFVDTLADGLAEGKLEFDDFVDDVKKMLARIAVNSIVVNVVGGAFGLSNPLSKAANGQAITSDDLQNTGFSLDNLNKLWSNTKNLFMGNSIGTGMANTASNLFGYGTATDAGYYGLMQQDAIAAMSGMPNWAAGGAGLVGGYAGTKLADHMFRGEYVGTGSQIGAAGGAYAGGVATTALMANGLIGASALAGPIGIMIGAALGAIAGGGIGELLSDKSKDTEWFRFMSNPDPLIQQAQATERAVIDARSSAVTGGTTPRSLNDILNGTSGATPRTLNQQLADPTTVSGATPRTLAAVAQAQAQQSFNVNGLIPQDSTLPRLASANSPFGVIAISGEDDFSGDRVAKAQAVVNAISQIDTLMSSVMTAEQIANSSERLQYVQQSNGFGETGGTLEDAIEGIVSRRISEMAAVVSEQYNFDLGEITGDLAGLTGTQVSEKLANAIQTVNTIATQVFDTEMGKLLEIGDGFANDTVAEATRALMGWMGQFSLLGGNLQEFISSIAAGASALQTTVLLTNSSFDGVVYSLEQVGLTGAALVSGVDRLRIALAETGMTLDQFTALQSAYYEAAYTEEERAQHQMNAARRAIADWNAETGNMIQSLAELRQWVESLDESSVHYAGMMASAMQASSAFIALEQAMQALGEQATTLEEALDALKPESVRNREDFAKSMNAFSSWGVEFPTTEEALYELALSGELTAHQVQVLADNLDTFRNALSFIDSEVKSPLLDQLDETYEEIVDRVNTRSDAYIEDLHTASDAYLETLETEHDTRIDNLNEQLDLLNEWSQVLRSAENALESLYRQAESPIIDATRNRMLGKAQDAISLYQETGRFPTDIDSILSSLGTVEANDFATMDEWQAAIAENARVISDLMALSGLGSSDISAEAKLLEQQIEQENKLYEQQQQDEQDRLQALIDAEDYRLERELDALSTQYDLLKDRISSATLEELSVMAAQTGWLESIFNVITDVFDPENEQRQHEELLQTLRQMAAMFGEAYYLPYAQDMATAMQSGVFTGSQGHYQIPGFATGGFHTGGLRIVGEQGPEIEYTGPSHISSNKSLPGIFADANTDVVRSLQEVRQELAEMKRMQFEQVKVTQEQTKIYRRWDGEGLPPDRMDYAKAIAEGVAA